VRQPHKIKKYKMLLFATMDSALMVNNKLLFWIQSLTLLSLVNKVSLFLDRLRNNFIFVKNIIKYGI